MTQQEYSREIEFIFNRFPSYQKAGKVAYKPGIETMETLDALLGHPHKGFRTIHVAGTNGKGSTSHMIAAALQKHCKVGLYTSPHLIDFRERVKVDGKMVPQEFVYSFLQNYKEKFVELGASFFEITTALAFAYFAHEKVDVAVIECGLGGRLDSTNIIVPVLSVITNIGLDHCEHLGFSLGEIAAEKAGIIKSGVPVVIGERGCVEVEEVFLKKAGSVGAPVLFAEDEWVRVLQHAGEGEQGYAASLINDLKGREMDLKGACQEKNIKSVVAALDVLRQWFDVGDVAENICNAAAVTGLRGRWETLSVEPLVICDTGHNSHGFKVLGPQLEAVVQSRMKMFPHGKFFVVFGVVADKDIEAIVEYLPRNASYRFVNARGTRALPAMELERKMRSYGFEGEAVEGEIGPFLQQMVAGAGKDDFIFVGGSTFVVAEALEIF